MSRTAAPRPRRTVASAVSIEDKGLHTGRRCRVTLVPAGAGEGVVFVRDGKRLTLDQWDPEASRCSALKDGTVGVQTVEHVLSAVSMAGLTDLRIECTGDELPALDGSALPYWDLIERAGTRRLEGAVDPIVIDRPVFLAQGTSALYAEPSPDGELEVAYTLDYDHPALKDQHYAARLTAGIFAAEIAPARTFCTRAEAEELRRRGYGLGADTTNTLVMDTDGPVDNTLRFADEAARHKTLDLLGDLALAGAPLIGRIIGVRSGHRLNRELVRALKAQR